jgi:hypothetical protein
MNTFLQFFLSFFFFIPSASGSAVSAAVAAADFVLKCGRGSCQKVFQFRGRTE